jgi:catechol 2,3-dioxygenase-like lactoylglutathione lyase family enzyme
MERQPGFESGIPMKVIGIDHLVLTVKSIERTVEFYTRVLGMRVEVFGPLKRTALCFGPHKINLHQADNMLEPKAAVPTMGSGDLCFLVDDLDGAEAHLTASGVAVLVERSTRVGARGALTSIYIRDPDENLAELSVYQDGTKAAHVGEAR